MRARKLPAYAVRLEADAMGKDLCAFALRIRKRELRDSMMEVAEALCDIADGSYVRGFAKGT